MKKNLSPLFTLLMTVLLAMPAIAGMSKAEKNASSLAETINQFGMPKPSGLIGYDDLNPTNRPAQWVYSNRSRQSLGLAIATVNAGVGEVIDNTYDDLQSFVNQGRNVSHSYDAASGYVDVHFVYQEFNDVEARNNPDVFEDPNKTGYNVWNANDSTWPWGQEAGCIIQTGDSVESTDSHLAIMPGALVVITARDNYSARSAAAGWRDLSGYLEQDGHWYWQEDRHSCYYDTGGIGSNSKVIDPAEYQPGMLGGSAAQTDNPLVAIQLVGNDTITHIAVQEYPYHASPSGAPNLEYRVLKYFRKTGSSYTGAWEEPRVIDTVHTLAYPCLSASPYSDKVSLAWTNTSPTGILYNERYDQDCFYRESTNGGVDWGPVVNFTNYPRYNEASATALMEVNTIYDSQDRLHIIWSAVPTSMNPWGDGYFWGDLSTNLYHWCDAIGTISKIAHGAYGVAARSIVCGLGGPGGGYIMAYSISECDGNLYCVYNQIHSRINELGLEDGSDDCSNDSQTLASANWEMFLKVSLSLDGLFWDAPRNLSNTYTPGCNSLGGDNGPCGSEYKPTVEPYGLNESGLNLKWPPGAMIDPDTLAFGIDSAYTGNYFLNMMYLDDEFPGSWYLGGPSGNEVPDLNALKWLRVACVEPVQAPQIKVTPHRLFWSTGLHWVRNGQTNTITFTVINDGNQALAISEIGVKELAGSGWLSASEASLAVPAGFSNRETFDIVVDASAMTYGMNSSTWLVGEIFLKSDAGNNDSLIVPLYILAADELQGVDHEIAATSSAWDPKKSGPSAAGDNFALSISNCGELGDQGLISGLEANLDFARDGGECRTDERGGLYLWSSAPFIIQHDGGGVNMRVTTSLYGAPRGQEYTFDPLLTPHDISSGVSTGGQYDSVFTGAFANRDTSLILERTFFAPRNNPDNPSFVVCKTVMYSGDGKQHDNVTIGSFTDWDIPSVKSPNNTVHATHGWSTAGEYVYAQGTDADTSDLTLICQENINRFGTELFLYWHTNTEYNADNCAANETSWGSWGGSQLISGSAPNGYLKGRTDPDAGQWYDSIRVKNGVFANDSSFDQAIWVTYLFDQSVGIADTLTFYTLFATLHNGSFTNFEDNLVNAREWYASNIRDSVCLAPSTCCEGATMGNVDCFGIIDIGDVTVMIQNLFITLNDPCCEAEADVDQSGLVDIGDLTIIISSLFITLNDMNPCP